jgi:acyl-CoA hydrolase
MGKIIALADLDLTSFMQKGDTVIWGQATGEPVSLTEVLLRQRRAVGYFNVLLGACFSHTIQAEHADSIRFFGNGGVGSNRRLAKAGAVEVLPCHISTTDQYIASGIIPCDVVLVQVSPPNERGEYSLGLISDYIRTAVDKARVVIAEVNDQVPQTYCQSPLRDSDIDVFVHVSRDPVELASAEHGDRERRIAEIAAEFIPEFATLQMGNGAIPEAIVSALKTRRGLGIHSGMIGDSIADLMEAGVVTNEHKEIDRGITVTGCLMGTRRLARFAAKNPDILMCSVSHTHGQNTLQKLSKFVAINSAIEVDLTGQVNAEAAGLNYIGTVGGQVDYGRAASTSQGGCSIIALPATAKGNVSKIVASLSGPVTTSRSDVGVIVTEFGAADLRGKSLPQRMKAMVEIADPAHRESLDRAVHLLRNAAAK